jgi:hypothetical protein
MGRDDDDIATEALPRRVLLGPQPILLCADSLAMWSPAVAAELVFERQISHLIQ